MVKGHSSSVHPDVPNKKGKTNWVEEEGGLPSFVKRVAKHIKADSAGMTWSHAIASAISQLHKMKTPEAKKALAEWEAMKARARAKRVAGRGMSNNSATTGNLDQAQYSQSQRGVNTLTTAGLTADEAAARATLKERVQQAIAARSSEKEISLQKVAIARTEEALKRAKPGGTIYQRMQDRLFGQQDALSRLTAVQLANSHYNPNQLRDHDGKWTKNPSPQFDGNLNLKVSAPAKPAAPVKKNSVEYWQRALEKTQEAKGKAKYGGKIWEKMAEREQDQQLMIKYMKQHGHATLTEADWVKAKPDFISLKPKPDTPEAPKPTENAGIGKAIDSAQAYATKYNLDTYVYKSTVSGNFVWDTATPSDQPKYAKISPNGTITQSDAMKAGSAAATPKAAPSLGSYEKISAATDKATKLAIADNKDYYVFKNDDGQFQVSTEPPTAPGLKYFQIDPDGDPNPKKVPEAGAAKDMAIVDHPDYVTTENKAKDLASMWNDSHVIYKDGTGQLAIAKGKQPAGVDTYVKIRPNGNVTEHKPGDSQTFDLGPDAVNAAKLKAAADGKNYYTWSDGGPYQMSANPPPKEKLGDGIYSYAEIEPNGTVSVKLPHDPYPGEAMPSASSGSKNIKWEEPPAGVLNSMNPDDKESYLAAIDDAKISVASTGDAMYVFKNQGEFAVDDVEPSAGVKYTKVWPTGAITNSGAPAYGAAPHPNPTPNTASPTAKVPTTADVPLVGENAAAKGPATEFDFPNADTRATGLDALGDTVKPYVEGTPEGDALKARFLPDHMEVAAHYKAAEVKMSAGAKSTARKYTGSYYGTLNNALRGKQSMTPEVANGIEKLDEAMAAYKTAEPMMVHRGVHSFPEGDMVGKMVQDPGYMSTAVGKPFGSATQLHIFVPAGTHGVSVDGLFADGGQHAGEKEFILPRGTMLMISKDETVAGNYGTGTRHITATVVPIPKDHAPINGPAAAPGGISSKAYTAEGLEFLRVNGRAKWAKRYANGAALALARRTWYNSPISR